MFSKPIICCASRNRPDLLPEKQEEHARERHEREVRRDLGRVVADGNGRGANLLLVRGGLAAGLGARGLGRHGEDDVALALKGGLELVLLDARHRDAAGVALNHLFYDELYRRRALKEPARLAGGDPVPKLVDEEGAASAGGAVEGGGRRGSRSKREWAYRGWSCAW